MGTYHIRSEDDDYDIKEIWEVYPTLFSINLYHGGHFTSFPERRYDNGHISLIDLLDSARSGVPELNEIRVELGYSSDVPHYFQYREPNGDLDHGLHALAKDSDVVQFLKLLGPDNRVLDVYIEHGNSSVMSFNASSSTANLDDIQAHQDKESGSESDSDEDNDNDFIVGEDNDMDEADVDMRDFNFNVDVDVEDEAVDNQLDEADFDLGVLDNDLFESGSESNENLASIRRKKLKYMRRGNANDNNFFIGQMFGTKVEVKQFIRKHTIETRRLLKIVKDDKERVRVVCVWDGGETPKENSIGLKKETAILEGGDKDKGKNVGVASEASSTLETQKHQVKERHVGGRGKRKTPPNIFVLGFLLVSRDKESESWMVKTFNDHHKCLQSRSIAACTSTLLAEQLMDQIEENPNIPVKAVQEQFQRKYEVSVSRMQAFRARCKAQLQLHGDYTAQYGLLRDYRDELLRTNPGTTITVDVETCADDNSTTRQFKRIHICLGSLKEGFKAIRRQLLGLDGAFMKGPYPGQVLSAVGIDNNNGIYPVSYAIVEAENINSWTWFLKCLGDDLDLSRDSNFTFVSDRQKGILEAVSRLYPCAEHEFCLRHVYENMRVLFKGKAYKDILWKLATSTTVVQFERGMDELKAMDTDAHHWLSKIDPKHWSRSHFSGKAHSDVLLNNMCEVFNSKLVNGRDKPIITVLEYIREYLMRRIVNVVQVIEKSDGPLTPTASKLFEIIKNDASKYVVSWNGGDQYGVSGPGGDQCVVDASKRCCSCRRWKITGMPYKHAVATIWNMTSFGQQVGIPESWVSPLYKLDTWKQVYNFKIFPINGKSLWPKSTVPTTFIPPKHHKPVGRPKKKRKRSVLEKEDGTRGGKLSRKNVSLSCSKCKNKGHNSRTCKGQPADQNEGKTIVKNAAKKTVGKNGVKTAGKTGKKFGKKTA